MDLQETIALRIKRETGSHLAILRTRRSIMNYSRIIGEAPMNMMNPSVMVSRLDLVVLEFARLEMIFFDFRRVSGILGYL